MTINDATWLTRVTEALGRLERIADRAEDPDRALVARIVMLEELVHEVVTLIANPEATHQQWRDLDERLREALP